MITTCLALPASLFEIAASKEISSANLISGFIVGFTVSLTLGVEGEGFCNKRIGLGVFKIAGAVGLIVGAIVASVLIGVDNESDDRVGLTKLDSTFDLYSFNVDFKSYVNVGPHNLFELNYKLD